MKLTLLLYSFCNEIDSFENAPGMGHGHEQERELLLWIRSIFCSLKVRIGSISTRIRIPARYLPYVQKVLSIFMNKHDYLDTPYLIQMEYSMSARRKGASAFCQLKLSMVPELSSFHHQVFFLFRCLYTLQQ